MIASCLSSNESVPLEFCLVLGLSDCVWIEFNGLKLARSKTEAL